MLLPKPEVGLRVLVDGREQRFIVKAVSSGGARVNLMSEYDPEMELLDVPCLDLLLDEGESAN